MDADIIKQIEVEPGPRGTLRFTAPNWVLVFLILGGIGINTINIYLLKGQIEEMRREIDRHVGQPSHSDTARLFNELFNRLDRDGWGKQ